MRHVLPIVLLALGLAGCGGEPEPAPAPAADTRPPTPAEAAAAASDPSTPTDAGPEQPEVPAGDFRVVSVELDRRIDGEGRAVQPASQFGPRDRIHAAVVGVGSSDGLTLSARWFGPDGSEIANAGQQLVPSKPTVTTFSISQPEPWPAGAYRVEVAINQRVVETREFRVE